MRRANEHTTGMDHLEKLFRFISSPIQSLRDNTLHYISNRMYGYWTKKQQNTFIKISYVRWYRFTINIFLNNYLSGTNSLRNIKHDMNIVKPKKIPIHPSWYKTGYTKTRLKLSDINLGVCQLSWDLHVSLNFFQYFAAWYEM